MKTTGIFLNKAMNSLVSTCHYNYHQNRSFLALTKSYQLVSLRCDLEYLFVAKLTIITLLTNA